MRRTLWLAAAWTMLALGCQQPTRPGYGPWQERFETTRASLPSAEELAASASPRPACERALATLRAAEGTLLPSPDEVVDQATRDWLNQALDTYQRCRPDERRGFERVARIEREIDASVRASARR